jgi:hypothetical protein
MRRQYRGYPRAQRRGDGDRVQAQRDQEQRVALQPHPGGGGVDRIVGRPADQPDHGHVH